MFRRLFQPGTLLSDAFGTLVVRVFGIALMFGMTTLTARFLGADQYGTFTAAWALAILLATVAPVGSDRILVRNLSTVDSPEEAGADTAVAHVCTALNAVVVLMAAAALAVFGDILHIDKSWTRTALLAAIMFIPIALTYLRQWVAIPLIGARSAVMPEQTVLPLIYIGCIALLRFSSIELSATIVTWTFATVMLTVWAVSLRQSRIWTAYSHACRKLPRPSDVWQRLSDGLPFVSVSIGGVVLQRCLPLVIAATCGFHATAQFALGMQYAALPAIPLGAVTLCMIPRCARHYQKGEYIEANRIVRLAATVTLLSAVLLSLATWFMGPFLVTVLGKSYAGINVILPTLLLATIADSFAGPAIPVMQTMKLESVYSRALYGFLPLQIGFIWMCSRVAELEGAAMAYLASRIAWNAIIILIIWKTREILCVPFFQIEQIKSCSQPIPKSVNTALPVREQAVAC
jgi:O-antigen/teichoic acid export membrane protein